MKKLLSLLLVLALSLSLALALAGCPAPAPEGTPTGCTGNGGEGSGDQPTPPTLPTGYQWFDNDAIRFAYPSDWVMQEGSVTMLVNATGMGNNITVAYEPKSNIYANMDEEDFATMFAPVFEAMGATVTDASVMQTRNASGQLMTRIGYTLTMNGSRMYQTMFILPANNLNYVVTVTETGTDTTLRTNVFNTLTALA